MGYYVDTMIGIRTGGVFSVGDPLDMEGVKKHIAKVIESMRDTPYEHIDLIDGLDWFLENSVSRELIARKGGYVVIAGVFNYWKAKQSFEFARRLSEEFGTEVMIMSWDEQTNAVASQIFVDGEPRLIPWGDAPVPEKGEDRLKAIIRRML